MTNEQIKVIAGIDTHADTHHVALITEHGKRLGDRKFLAVGSGYREIAIGRRSTWQCRDPGQAVSDASPGNGSIRSTPRARLPDRRGPLNILALQETEH